MSAYLISKIIGEEIKDSRGNPTLKVKVFVGNTEDDFSTPSGASTGVHEAHELRDMDGVGVQSAIEKINNIITPALIGQDILNQKEIDRIMLALDGTPNKDNLGGNSMIGVSIACAKVAAKVSGLPVYEYLRTLAEVKPSRAVPFLYMNLINGGKHVKPPHVLAFQEYHVVPDTEDVKEAVEIGLKIDNTLKEIMSKELGPDSVVMGDEGGFAPKISDIRMPLVYLTEAIKQNNLQNKVRLALDVAASSFYKDGKYLIDGKELSAYDLMDVYKNLVEEFNLLSIEDPFHEEDFENFTNLHSLNFGGVGKILVVGDDLTVTNATLLKKAITEKSINAMIIKPNQVGTLSETLEAMKLARENNIELIVSHRSGETNDNFIADLAYAFNVFGLKAGAPTKTERVVKYERLIEILEIQKVL
jgi:enolase